MKRIITLGIALTVLAAASVDHDANAKLGSCSDPILLGTTISETGPFSTLTDRWREMTEYFFEESTRRAGFS